MGKRFSALLVEDGVVSASQMEEALTRQAVFGGRLGTNLLEMGLINEEVLAQYLSRSKIVPAVAPSQLIDIDPDALRVLDLDTVERLRVLPIRLYRRGTADVLVEDPLSARLIAEFKDITGFTFTPFIAPEFRFAQCLQVFFGRPMSQRHARLLRQYPLEVKLGAGSGLSALVAGQTGAGLEKSRGARSASEYRRERQLGFGWSQSEVIQFLRELFCRDTTLELLVGYAGNFALRRVLLVVGKDRLQGFLATGMGRTPAEARDVRMPLRPDGPLEAVRQGDTYFKGHPMEAGLHTIYEQLDVSVPPHCVLLPVPVGPRAGLVLLLDDERLKIDIDALVPLFLVIQEVTTTLERIIKLSKRDELPPEGMRVPSIPERHRHQQSFGRPRDANGAESTSGSMAPVEPAPPASPPPPPAVARSVGRVLTDTPSPLGNHAPAARTPTIPDAKAPTPTQAPPSITEQKISMPAPAPPPAVEPPPPEPPAPAFDLALSQPAAPNPPDSGVGLASSGARPRSLMDRRAVEALVEQHRQRLSEEQLIQTRGPAPSAAPAPAEPTWEAPPPPPAAPTQPTLPLDGDLLTEADLSWGLSGDLGELDTGWDLPEVFNEVVEQALAAEPTPAPAPLAPPTPALAHVEHDAAIRGATTSDAANLRARALRQARGEEEDRDTDRRSSAWLHSDEASSAPAPAPAPEPAAPDELRHVDEIRELLAHLDLGALRTQERLALGGLAPLLDGLQRALEAQDVQQAQALADELLARLSRAGVTHNPQEPPAEPEPPRTRPLYPVVVSTPDAPDDAEEPDSTATQRLPALSALDPAARPYQPPPSSALHFVSVPRDELDDYALADVMAAEDEADSLDVDLDSDSDDSAEGDDDLLGIGTTQELDIQAVAARIRADASTDELDPTEALARAQGATDASQLGAMPTQELDPAEALARATTTTEDPRVGASPATPEEDNSATQELDPSEALARMHGAANAAQLGAMSTQELDPAEALARAQADAENVPVLGTLEIDLEPVLEGLAARTSSTGDLEMVDIELVPVAAEEEPPAPSPSRQVIDPEALAALQRYRPVVRRLVAGVSVDSRDAARELLASGGRALPALLELFPGPLLLDRYDYNAATQPPLEEHGPLLAVIAGFGDLAAPAIVGLLDVASVDVRFYATSFFTRVRYEPALLQLTERLFDRDGQIRDTARNILRQHRASTALAPVLASLRHDAALGARDAWRAEQAIVTLGILGDVEAAPVLFPFVEGSQRRLQEVAHRALCLIALDDHGFSARRWEKWYERHQGESRQTWIVEALNHGDEAVRELAAAELRLIPGLIVNYSPQAPRPLRQRAQKIVADWFRDHA